MASRKKSLSSGHRDRISGLPDDVLGHVLSFLPTKEAARAAVLSGRWRHVFGSVHTISFQEEEGEREHDWITFYYESEERKSCSGALLDGVGAALLCHRRCASDVPVCRFHFAFDSWHWWDKVAVDQWLAYVLPRRDCGTHPGLHLDLRFRISGACALGDAMDKMRFRVSLAAARALGGRKRKRDDAGSDSDDDAQDNKWRYLLPPRLFSCTVLRTLCLVYCRLKLPRINAINLPFLETLRLTALGDSGRSIQRLISSCPRLAELTLEAMWNLKRVSVLDKRLRRFTLHCCHNLKSVDIDASELRSLEYRGRGPPKLCLHGSPAATIPLCTIDFCKPLSEGAEAANFTRFLKEISKVKHLHLHHGRLESRFFDVGLPLFSTMTRLTLQGCIRSSSTVGAVCRILEQTPNLEVLKLLLEESEDDPDVVDDMTIIDKPIFSLPCLRRRLTEVSVEGYEGSKPEKMLVKPLLRNALVLERLGVVFAHGLKSKRKNRLEAQMRKWGVANSKKIFT